MRLIVTRPQREAQRWVPSLSGAGYETLALPLIALAPAADQAALRSVWQHLDDYAAVMFVSGNAVDYFFALKPLQALCFSSHSAIKTRAWATGPGTTAALLRAGVPADRIDAPAADAGQFDSEALWQVVGAGLQSGQRVLIVRGGDASVSAAQGVGREWFAHRVAQAGAQADFVVAYQRSMPRLTPDDLRVAQQAAADGSVWLFSSSEAIVNLQSLLPQQNWAGARAVATHARIAAAARAAGFGVVIESSPKLDQLLASIESLA